MEKPSTHPMGTISSECSDRLLMRMEGIMKQEAQKENDFPKTSAPAERALLQAGYSRLKQLTKVTEAELARLHGMGPKALRILREALQAQGMSFAKPKLTETASKKKRASPVSRTDKVDEFMSQL